MSFNNKIIIFFIATNLLIVSLTFNTNAQENFDTWLGGSWVEFYSRVRWASFVAAIAGILINLFGFVVV